MSQTTTSVNQTPCKFRAISYCLSEATCDRCQESAAKFSVAQRTAIDLDLEQPILLGIEVSVHNCSACHHYFRAQPPFLGRDGIYTDQVIEKAIRAVFEDDMAFRRVTRRLARQFSGILCVDEVYQGRLALLLAVDPRAPNGDRLIGYQLVQGTVNTDGSSSLSSRSGSSLAKGSPSTVPLSRNTTHHLSRHESHQQASTEPAYPAPFP